MTTLRFVGTDACVRCGHHRDHHGIRDGACSAFYDHEECGCEHFHPEHRLIEAVTPSGIRLKACRLCTYAEAIRPDAVEQPPRATRAANAVSASQGGGTDAGDETMRSGA